VWNNDILTPDSRSAQRIILGSPKVLAGSDLLIEFRDHLPNPASNALVAASK
jgi:hypothetical protein